MRRPWLTLAFVHTYIHTPAVRVRKCQKYIGNFNVEEDAARAYDTAYINMHGLHAAVEAGLNLIESEVRPNLFHRHDDPSYLQGLLPPAKSCLPPGTTFYLSYTQ